MNFNEYQDKTSKTVKNSIKNNKTYFALGLCGEAGEVADKIKKGIRDGNLDVHSLMLELGDVMWYLAQLSACYGIRLEKIADANIEKLSSRKKRDVIGGNGDER